MEDPVQPADPVPNSMPAPVPAPFPEEECVAPFSSSLEISCQIEFLVDSGASVLVFPGPKSTSINGINLLTADGTSMVCSESCIIPLHFSCGTDSKVYSWNFQLPPVSIPLIGKFP